MMGWFTYYKLLKKYGGNINKATKKERDEAAKANPNTPSAALKIALEKYESEVAHGRNA